MKHTESSGACFCGAVEITVTGAPVAMGYCHTMSARVIDEACVSVSLASKVETDERTIVEHPSIATPLRAALARIARDARTSA